MKVILSIFRFFIRAVLLAVGLVFLLIGLILIICLIINDRRTIKNRYEWLNVLSHYEWKDVAQIKDDMQKKKKDKRFSVFIVTFDLLNLVRERLVTVRLNRDSPKLPPRVPMPEFQLTTSGSFRKHKISGDEKTVSAAGPAGIRTA